MTPEQIRDAWNAQADEHNQWDSLCWQEIVEWTIQCVQDKRKPYIAVNNDRITIDPVTGNVSIGSPAAQSQWVGLTDNDRAALLEQATYMDEKDYGHLLSLAEEKLKEKNHG